MISLVREVKHIGSDSGLAPRHRIYFVHHENVVAEVTMSPSKDEPTVKLWGGSILQQRNAKTDVLELVAKEPF